MSYGAELPAIWEHEQVDRFYNEQPALAEIYDCFLRHAAEAHEAMPRPRYGQQGRAPGLVTPERLNQLLGIDTMHQWHPIRQHWIAQRYIEDLNGELSPEAGRRLLLTNLFHDAGEPFSRDGDAQYGEAKDEDDEHQARQRVLKHCLPNADDVLNDIEPILSGEHKELARHFRAIENLGYYATGARAASLFLGNLGPHATPGDLEVTGGIAQSVHRNNHEFMRTQSQHNRTVRMSRFAYGGILTVAAAQSFDRYGFQK